MLELVESINSSKLIIFGIENSVKSWLPVRIVEALTGDFLKLLLDIWQCHAIIASEPQAKHIPCCRNSKGTPFDYYVYGSRFGNAETPRQSKRKGMRTVQHTSTEESLYPQQFLIVSGVTALHDA